MKLLFFILLASSQGFACPDLRGSYRCVDDQGVYILEVEQEKDLGDITHFYFKIPKRSKSAHYIADNLARAHSEPGVRNAQKRAYCERYKLHITIEGYVDRKESTLYKYDRTSIYLEHGILFFEGFQTIISGALVSAR